MCGPSPAHLQVNLIEPVDPSNASAGFRVTVIHEGQPEVMFARKVVLATGIQVWRGSVSIGISVWD